MDNETVKEWFNEAIIFDCYHHKTIKEEFILYKGFRITNKDEEYSILNTRDNDYYAQISNKHKSILLEHGFVKGSRIISHARNLKRVEEYKRELEILHKSTQACYNSLLFDEVDEDFIHKKIKNNQGKTEQTETLLAIYEAKVKLFEQQY